MTLGNNNSNSLQQTISRSYNRYLNHNNYSYFSTCEIDDYEENQGSYISDNHEFVEPIIPLNGPPMDSPWPMFGYDIRNTGQSPYSTINNEGVIKWSFRTEIGIESSPAIGADGSIYFGSNDHNLYALNSNGTIKWTYDCNGWITSSPAIDYNNTIYVGSWDCCLYAINNNGILKWKFPSGGLVKSSPTIGDDGTIYFGVVNSNRIYAVTSDGVEKWYYETVDSVFSSPAVGKDGTIYVTSNDNNLYALNTNGSLKWKYKMSDWPGSPAIADNGTVYVPSLDGNLYAVYPNGTLFWKSKIGYGSGHTPSIAKDDTIYIGGKDLYAINPNGTRKWTFSAGDNYIVSSFTNAISSEGTIYIGVTKETERGDIIAVNPDGTERWRVDRIANDWVDSSPCIAEDGTVYIGSTSGPYPHGYLYAIGKLDPDAPSAPIITGPSEGRKNKEYSFKFKSIDPNGDDVFYYINWNDGKKEEWIGPYSSGYELTLNHTWKNENTFTIRVRARDTDNLWGPWSEHEITIPRTRATSYQWLWERFPLLERLLTLLL